MAAKRIRCACGKIYDAGSFALCPDCQTPSPFSAAVQEVVPLEAAPKTGVPSPLPPLPLEKGIMLDSDRKKRPWLYFRAEHPFLAILLDYKKIVLTAGLAALVGLGWAVRPPSKPTPGASPRSLPLVSSATVAEKENPPSPTSTPPPAEVLKVTSSQNLAAEIAKAKPGSTIQLAAGTYRSGFIIDRPLHLIGDSTGGPVIIESNNLGALQINAVGVILENIRFAGEPGGNFAVVKALDKSFLELRQCVFDTTGNFGAAGVGTAKLEARGCIFSTSGRGTGVQLEESAKAELTDCTFKNNRWGFTIREFAQGKATRCRFEGNGFPDLAGYSIGGTGEKTYASAEQCTFTENPGGVVANKGSHLILKGCTFKNNGVTDEPGHVAYGIVNANSGGQFLINDCTFEANRQGVIVQTGGSVKMENCNFTATGFRTPSKALAFFCSAISAEHKGSKVSLYKTNIRGSQHNGINIITGASLVMEDCEVRDGLRNAFGVGAGDSNSEVTVVNCRILDQKVDGFYIAPDSVAKISKSIIARNGGNAIFVAGDKASAVVEDCEISSNQGGLLADRSAFAVITDSLIAGNSYGVQTGTAKSKKGAVVFLNKCRITGSSGFGAGAFTGGTLNLDDCSFSKNRKGLYQGGGVILQTWSGPKDEIDKKNGLGPTGKTGGRIGLESTPSASASTTAGQEQGSSPHAIKRLHQPL